MLKKASLLSISLLIFSLGILVSNELKELQREMGSRRIRMMRNLDNKDRKTEFIDLSSP